MLWRPCRCSKRLELPIWREYGVRTGSCIITKNRRTEEEQKKRGKRVFFLDKGQNSLAYKHFQLVNNSCSCFLQVKWQWFFLVDNIYWDEQIVTTQGWCCWRGNKEGRLQEMRGVVVYIYILFCMTCGSSGPAAWGLICVLCMYCKKPYRILLIAKDARDRGSSAPFPTLAMLACRSRLQLSSVSHGCYKWYQRHLSLVRFLISIPCLLRSRFVILGGWWIRDGILVLSVLEVP
jgi:hypothetical protein